MPTNKELLFTMQAQLQDNWCWAANAASISVFYDRASTWTQCGVANISLTRPDCCLGIRPNPCDEPWYLERALAVTKNFSDNVITGPLAENDITDQIDRGLIIGARIGWSGGGGHFVSIYGYNSTPSGLFVYIGDPIYGNSTINLDTFTSNYQGSGTWTHSYHTKSTIATMLQYTAIHENILKQANLIKESFAPDVVPPATPTSVTPAENAMPHEIYTVTLASLKEGDPDIRKGGLRLIDPSGTNNRQMYDFSENGPEGKVQQIIHSNTFTQKYQGVLEQLQESQKTIPERFTLRTIRQPELKIEAFWLHDERNPGRDRFEPVITSSIFEAGKTYSEKEFFTLLESAAKNRRTYTDDLLGG